MNISNCYIYLEHKRDAKNIWVGTIKVLLSRFRLLEK